MADNIEERFKALEAELAKVKHETERAQAYGEIRNLISRLQYLHGTGRDPEITNLFAKRPDTRLYFGEMGYWEGADAPIKGAGGKEPPPPGIPSVSQSRPGGMSMHIMLQPLIVVAGDGQTAQAVFWAAGIMAGKDRKTGEPNCSWEWNRYGDDFIKEDGEWKVWHHHVFPLFQIGYDDKWADQFKKRGMPPAMPPPEEGQPMMQMPKPDHPATDKDKFYDPDEVLPDIPLPQPYQTFDPKQAY